MNRTTIRRPPFREQQSVDVRLDIEAEVTFTRTDGTPAYFDNAFGNWLPGDEASVDVHSITHPDFFDRNGKPLDLTPYLSLESVHDKLMQEVA